MPKNQNIEVGMRLDGAFEVSSKSSETSGESMQDVIF